MRSSCIEHPRSGRRVSATEWGIIFCEGNRCAALLLGYFEWCHNWKLEQALKSRMENEALQLRGEWPVNSESLEQWHTEDELEKALLGFFERKTIREAMALIEGKGAIQYVFEPRFKANGMPDRTRHFNFQPDVINTWLRDVYPTTDKRLASIRKIRRMEKNNQEEFLPDGQSPKLPDGKKPQTVKSPDGQTEKMADGEMFNFKDNLPSGKNSALHSNTYCMNSTYGEGDSIEAAKRLLQEGRITSLPHTSLLLRICLIPQNLPMTKAQEHNVKACLAWLIAAEATPQMMEGFSAWWKSDWRGKDGKSPTPNQVREAWPHYINETQPKDETENQSQNANEVNDGEHLTNAGNTGAQAAPRARATASSASSNSGGATKPKGSSALAKLEARQRERERQREQQRRAASESSSQGATSSENTGVADAASAAGE